VVARNVEGRQKAFDAIEKLIADGESLKFLELSKKIGVPATTVKRVFDENFKGQGVIGRSRNATKVIKEIIDSGVTDINEIKNIARNKYKINLSERAIRSAVNIVKDATVEEYVEDIRKMVKDPNYVSKYIKPAKEFGEPANLRAAKAIVANETENFKLKYDRNIANTKRKKRAADPIKREEDLVKKAERQAKRRAGEKDVATTPRESKINLNQRAYARALNKPIKDNPSLVLNDKDLMERLSITVSKDGNIIKVPTGLSEKFLKKRGLFEVEHQRDIYKGGRGRNLPYNRNLIAGPYNRAGGFKQRAEQFIEKNPDPSNPKVQNILKVAEDLKITIRPDVPAGIFPTKALGYKQIADPIEKFKDVGEKFVSENFLENFIAKVKAVPGGCRAVVTAALGGPIDKCEAIIKTDPKKAALKLNNAITATKGPLKDLKKDSQKLIRLYRGEEPARKTELYKSFKGQPGMYEESLKGRFFFDNPADARYYAQRQGTLTGNVKSVDVPERMVNIGRKVAKRRRGPNLSSEVILPKKFVGKETINIPQTAMARAGAIVEKLKYDNIKGAFVNVNKGDSVAPQSEIKQYAVDNPMEVKVGEPAKLPKPNKSVLKTVGKTLAAVGAPLPTALLDTYFINEQVKQGKTTEEIVSNPLNWLGLATMSPLSKAAGIDKAGKVNTALRLGLNPGTIRGISRFVGLPGLALSTAMTAYDQYTKYKNQEGFIYKLFNKEES
jgi:hypothetical protein